MSDATTARRTFPRRLELLLWPALFLALVLNGMALLEGGYLHYEGQFFLAAHLDDRGTLQQLFSAHFNEWDCYQGRELSFALGHIDSQLIVIGARFGAPHLYSLTTFAAILATAVFLWRLLPRLAPGLSNVSSGLFVALFLTTPVAGLSGFYYRPAKAAATLFFVLVVGRIISALESREGRRTRGDWLAIVAFATLMGVSDRQGLFLIIATGVVVAIDRWPLDYSARRVLGALTVALLMNIFWSSGIGPALATWADGFSPDQRNERLPIQFTFGNFVHYKTAVVLWLDQLAFYFGSSGVVGAVLAICGGALALSGKKRVRVFAGLIVGAAMGLTLYVAMYAKLGSLVWPESQRVYYWLPGAVAISMAAGVAAAHALSRWPRLRFAIPALLGSMVVSNLVALPNHRAIVRAGEQRPQILEASRVRECMRDRAGSIASAGLSPAAAQACARVRLAAFGTAGPGPLPKMAQPNPLLYCRHARKHQPALRSLGP